jgi:hypothetical protein
MDKPEVVTRQDVVSTRRPIGSAYGAAMLASWPHCPRLPKTFMHRSWDLDALAAYRERSLDEALAWQFRSLDKA